MLLIQRFQRRAIGRQPVGDDIRPLRLNGQADRQGHRQTNYKTQ